MVSVTLTKITTGTTNPWNWIFDGRYVYLVSFDKSSAILLDIKTKQWTEMSIPKPPEITGEWGFGGLFLYFSKTGSKVITEHYINTFDNEGARVKLEWDLESKTISSETVWRIVNSNITDKNTQYDTIVGRRLILDVGTVNPVILYIDAEKGEVEDSLDTGFGSYGPYMTKAWFAGGDDLIMLMGRHLNTANYYKYKIYSKSLSEIPGTNPGGDSPNGKIVLYMPLSDKLYIFGSGTTVNNSTPKIIWFDEDLNKEAETPLSSIYTYGRLRGYIPLGYDENHYLVFLALLFDNNGGILNEWSIGPLIIDSEITDSTRNIVSYTKIYTGTRDNRMNMLTGSNKAHDQAIPIVDKENKKAWTFAQEEESGDLYLLEFDYSDLNITEYNPLLYEVGKEKIPTLTQLNVYPL